MCDLSIGLALRQRTAFGGSGSSSNLLHSPYDLTGATNDAAVVNQWNRKGITIAADASDPQGGSTATQLTVANASYFPYVEQFTTDAAAIAAGPVTLSIYAKASGIDGIEILGDSANVVVNLNTGAITDYNNDGNVSATAVSQGSGWYLITATSYGAGVASSSFRIYLLQANGAQPSGTGGSILIWHPSVTRTGTVWQSMTADWSTYTNSWESYA
jgi:hypothetical protein